MRQNARPDLTWLVAKPIAHRGLHDAAAGVIENSPSAARAALAQGFGIECDVQLSSDGQAMVFHDFGLDRLTSETGRLADRTAAALAAITLKGSADPVLSLDAFLDVVGGRVPLVIEIKSRFDGDLRLTNATLDILATRTGQPIVLKSFDPTIVIALRTLAPQIPRGIVAMSEAGYGDDGQLDAGQKRACANLLHFDESQPDFLSWRVADLPAAAPFLCRSQLGLPVMSWTVRSDEDKKRAAAHADQMVFEGFVP